MSHENYKGNIELISGLIQKNKGTFPLMEAGAVAVYEQDGTEVRLDEKLRQLKEEATVSEDMQTAIVEKVFVDDRYTTLSGKVTTNSTDISAPTTGLKDRVSALEGKVDEGDNQELKLQFEEKESMLYLFTGDRLIKPSEDPDNSNVISSAGITGGGGAGASLNYSIALKQLDANNITFLNTDTPKIRYHATFIDTSVAEGEDNLVSQTLNFKMTVVLPSGAKNVYTFTGLSNTDLEYDLTEILSSQTGLILGDHSITLTASYTQEIENGDEIIPITIQSTKKWTVKITEMYLTSAFDDASVRMGDIPFSVTVYGDLNKTIHYNFGGEADWKTLEAPMSNYEYSITIPKQAHGNYPLEVYLTAEVNGKTITSNYLLFDIMFREEGNNTPIIRAVPAAKKGQQYSNLAIEYSVYTPNSLISEVTLAADGKPVSTLNVDRAEKVWNYKSAIEGKKVLTITSGETVRTLEIEIEKIPYTIEPVTAGLELDFSPQGRTNQDADYNIFKNNAFDGEGNEKPITWTLSDNFDWVNGGWKVDENEDSYFCIKAGTTATINYLLFNDANTLVGANKSKGNGKEFKIIFKTTNVASADTTWLSCLANPETGSEVGIQMDAHTAYVKASSGEKLEIPYSEEDKIEFDMNIVPISYNKEGVVDLTVQDIPMIMTYEDGTPVRPLVLTNDVTSFKQQNAVPITIGSPYCDVHIYRMKAYSTYLSDKNILNNFIADAPNGEEMIARYTRNQIYDAKTGKLTPESLAAACPHMRVIKISAPRFTNDKKDKVLETEIEMIYKNGDPVLDNWKAVYARHNGQGTSSNAYGYAGRNLELSLKEKETLRYKITRPEGVYNEDGELIIFGTIVEGKQDFFLDETLEQKVEDASTIATITTIPGTTVTLGDGSTTKKVSLTRDSVPTNYFNIKVNIASSEQANNALLQKRYDRYLPYDSYASANDDKVKNNMNFYNCVIFIQERNEDLNTHQEFYDNDWHFYSMGNIGDSKKTDDTRTSDPDDTTEFCVEIMDWNRELSAFPQDTKVQASLDKYTIKDSNKNVIGYTFITEENLQAGALFERDYSLKEYQEQNVEGDWVSYGYKVSIDETIDSAHIDKYYIDILEHDDYSEDYTYGFRYLNDDEDEEQIATAKAKWNEFYRFITRNNYYDDRRADENGKWLEDPAKITAWKNEFKNWFIQDAAFYYYLFTLRYTMVDNRAKNSFWHWGKCLDGQYRMDFWDYDNDTALGIDNTGKFTMSYGVEDHDVNDAGAAHFRAHNSTFFVRVADYFAEELIPYYKDKLENTDKTVFNSESLITEFDNWQSEFPEELWRCQYDRIYKRTYVGGYGSLWDNAINPALINKAADTQFLDGMMNGKKKYQRRQFERNQDVYMSSKFFGETNYQDMLELRGGGDIDPTGLVVKPSGDITITPYLNMYINVGSSNTHFIHHVKTKAGESVTLPYPEDTLEFSYLWGGSYLQSLGDLSPMYLRKAVLSNGKRLKQLILGNATPGYDNASEIELIITGNNKLLEELNVQNISKLRGAIPITNISSLRKLYAQGTNYQSVQFANNGLIEEAHLPASIDTIIANNLYYLHTLELEDYSKLEKLLINNCPKLADSGAILSLLNKSTNLKRIRVTDINWYLNDATLLNRLVKCTGIGEDNASDVEQSVLTGVVYLENVRQTELDAFAAAWPNLTVNYGYLVPQNKVTFKNYDGSTLGSISIDRGSYYPNPILIGLFDTPTKESTAQYTFEFAGWAKENTTDIIDITQEQISSDTVFIAQYEQLLRQYTVTWYGATNNEILETAVVYYGDEAKYSKDIPLKSPYNTVYFLFNEWDKSTAYITGDTKVYPVWAQADGAEIFEAVRGKNAYRTLNELSPIEIYALAQYKNKDGFATGDFIEFQLGYMPTYSDDATQERVLVENLTLDGKTYKVFNDIELFKEDKDFVIALDFTPGYRASGESAFLSCYQGYPERGFRVYHGTSNNITSLKVGTKTTSYPINPSSHIVTNEEQYREICVIRHKKGQEGFTVYRNNRYSLTPVEEFTLNIDDKQQVNYSGWSDGKHPLVIGADYDNGSFSNKAIGTVHYAKIWFNDIGEEDCRKICSWVYDKMYFDFVGGNRYYYSDSSIKCAASFVCQQLLDEAARLYTSKQINSNGWAGTELNEWMNSKLFNGLPILWKQILRKVVIKSIRNTESGQPNVPLRQETTQSDNYFYLPALAEVNSTFNTGVYMNELTSVQDGTYPVFGDSTENKKRVKTINGKPSMWWVRTPYYSDSASTSTLDYFNVVRYDGAVENRTSWQDISVSPVKYYTFSVGTPYGVCPCFSI